MSIQKEYFDRLPDGRAVMKYTLQNQSGASVSVLDLGGAIQQLLIPDQYDRKVDIVCGFDHAADYFYARGCHGALVGRFANRIANASFYLNGKKHELSANHNGSHLHGGFGGFHKKLWQVTPIDSADPSLVLFYRSPDGEEGYPGNLDVTVTYTLKEPATLSIRYKARTDAPTHVNLTNHAYFNLGGYDSGEIYDHVLFCDSSYILEIDDNSLPTGGFVPVEGTVFDFRTPKPLGKDIDKLTQTRGYDHCYCFSRAEHEPLSHRATLIHPQSGRSLRLFTTQPAVHLFTANFSNDPQYPFKGGVPQHPHCAVCLETQKMPDSPNHPHFTPTVLLPGEEYDHTTEYVFSVEK